MYRLFIIIFCFFNALSACAQIENGLSSINLAVVLPTNLDGLDQSQLSKLESRIIEAVTNNGVSATGYTQNFIIYPKFEIYSEKESKTGMRNLIILDCNLSLFIKQVNTNIIFSTYSKRIQSSGYNKYEALNNALLSIDPSVEMMGDFIKSGKDKIIKYYQLNCETILKKAETERSLKKFESALSLCLTIPEESTNCYDKAQAQAKNIFNELQKYKCQQYLQKAKGYYAEQNYVMALEYISWIDPTGSCATEAKNLINSISSRIDQVKREQWNFLLKTYTDEVAIKKAQIQSMNNLAISWLRSQATPVSYITIIR